MVKNFKGPDEKLCDGVETGNKFTYLGGRLNATGGCETAVTARSRIGWIKFTKCSEILKGRRFSFKTKGKVYKSCVRSAMLYGSEAWCVREKEMAILRRTERAKIRAMCGVKLLDQRNSEELMDLLGIKDSLDRMAKASSIRWYGHVLRKENENVIVKALKFEVSGSRGRGRPKQTWKKQVENEMKKNGLVKEDACDRTKWRGVGKTMTIRNPAYSVDGDNTGIQHEMMMKTDFEQYLFNL